MINKNIRPVDQTILTEQDIIITVPVINIDYYRNTYKTTNTTAMLEGIANFNKIALSSERLLNDFTGGAMVRLGGGLNPDKSVLSTSSIEEAKQIICKIIDIQLTDVPFINEGRIPRTFKTGQISYEEAAQQFDSVQDMIYEVVKSSLRASGFLQEIDVLIEIYKEESEHNDAGLRINKQDYLLLRDYKSSRQIDDSNFGSKNQGQRTTAGSIDELSSHQGNLDDLKTTDKTSLVNAINVLEEEQTEQEKEIETNIESIKILSDIVSASGNGFIYGYPSEGEIIEIPTRLIYPEDFFTITNPEVLTYDYKLQVIKTFETDGTMDVGFSGIITRDTTGNLSGDIILTFFQMVEGKQEEVFTRTQGFDFVGEDLNQNINFSIPFQAEKNSEYFFKIKHNIQGLTFKLTEGSTTYKLDNGKGGSTSRTNTTIVNTPEKESITGLANFQSQINEENKTNIDTNKTNVSNLENRTISLETDNETFKIRTNKLGAYGDFIGTEPGHRIAMVGDPADFNNIVGDRLVRQDEIKKYVDDNIGGGGTVITELQNKTKKLNEDGNTSGTSPTSRMGMIGEPEDFKDISPDRLVRRDEIAKFLNGDILFYPHQRREIHYGADKQIFTIPGLDLDKYKYVRVIVAEGNDYYFSRQNGEQILTTSNPYGSEGGWLTTTHRQGFNTFLRYNILLYENKIEMNNFEHTGYGVSMYLKLVIGYE